MCKSLYTQSLTLLTQRESFPPHTHTYTAPKPRTSAVLFCLLAKEARTIKGETGALVLKGQISNPRYRLRPLPAAPLVVRRRYLAVVPRLLPTPPLAVRRRYLIMVPKP